MTRVLGPRAAWSKVPTKGQLSIHEHLYNPLSKLVWCPGESWP